MDAFFLLVLCELLIPRNAIVCQVYNLIYSKQLYGATQLQCSYSKTGFCGDGSGLGLGLAVNRRLFRLCVLSTQNGICNLENSVDLYV